MGLIALLGVDAETGVLMLLYLDLAYEEAKREGKLATREDLRDAILHGAVKRLRPKFMTVATTFLGLMPIMLELLVYPPVYQLWKWHFEVKPGARGNRASAT